MTNKFDIFISYRREGGFEVANLIANKLRLSGYRVFLDIHAMHSGDFSIQLEEQVKKCKDFIWVLSPTIIKDETGQISRKNTLAYRDGVDYFRDEICWAIQYHKNIIPVFLDGFDTSFTYPKQLYNTIQKYNPSCDLHKLQAVEATRNQHFNASIDELKRYLHSYPIIKWAIISLFVIVITLLSVLFALLFSRNSTCNCTISVIESQPHTLLFKGGNIDLVVSSISRGACHIHNIEDKVIYTDIPRKFFGKKAIISFQSEGYIPILDTILLKKDIILSISRDDSYKRYWGHIGDSRSGLPLESVKVTMDEKICYTDSLGYFQFEFDIPNQSLYKRLSAYKLGYEIHEDNEVYPGTDNRFYLLKSSIK